MVLTMERPAATYPLPPATMLRPYPMPMMARSMAAPDAAAISIPNEGGKTAVSVGMQASIELLP